MDITNTATVTAAQASIIRRFDSQLWQKGERRPSQGELRDLETAGLAVQHYDHSFTLTDAGRVILRNARKAGR